MNFDISAMKLRAKSLVKQCGMTPALIEAMLWVLRVISVMCGSLSTQNGSIGGYIISGVTTLLLIFLPFINLILSAITFINDIPGLSFAM